MKCNEKYAEDLRNLTILMNRVKHWWVEGVLEKTLEGKTIFQLYKRGLPEAIEHPVHVVGDDDQIFPPNTKTIDVFDKMAQFMLILSEPELGKTTTLIELTRSLIMRATNDDSQPVPVILNLAAWNKEKTLLPSVVKDISFDEWLVKELSVKYLVPTKLGRNWLKNQRILFLLDGLDEVKRRKREKCIEAINQFIDKFKLPGLVICSRLKEYVALSGRLKLNGAICLEPLTLEQVNRYISVVRSKEGETERVKYSTSADSAISESSVSIEPICEDNVVPISTNERRKQEGKTKILFLGVNPTTTSRLRLDREVREIQTNLKLAKERECLEFKQEWAVTTDTLMQAILDESPNIIHFSGHGQSEGILIENEIGESKLITIDALASLFELFRDNLKCVVLNSCYSEKQAIAIKSHIPHVIGMTSALPDKSALAFSTGFYKAIGAGKSIAFAFKLGVAAILLGGGDRDKHKPILL